MKPFQTSFQTFATDFGIKGIFDAKVTRLDVLDPTENDEVVLLLEEDDPFAVRIDWHLSGAALCSLGGTWQVSLYIDDIDGVGPTGGQLGATKNIQVVGCQKDYSARFDIPANTVKPGLYQLVVAINHSPQGVSLDKLTENVGYAQTSPVKFTVTVAE